MDSEYSNHRQQLEDAGHPEIRIEDLNEAIHRAFKEHIVTRSTGYVLFEDVTVDELANAFSSFPILVKSILALVNVASRAVERDLGITLDTYATRVPRDKAAAIAGYIKPLLPNEAAIPSIVELDRYLWTDKQMRARKGRWEQRVTKTLSKKSKIDFKKRKFSCDGEKFELDGAFPAKGQDIEIGIDIKRIEARRDVHKRTDEIINKASKFKAEFPSGHFYAIVYFPFQSQHSNLLSRLNSPHIDGVYFAGEFDSSISTAMDLLASEIIEERNCS